MGVETFRDYEFNKRGVNCCIALFKYFCPVLQNLNLIKILKQKGKKVKWRQGFYVETF